MHYLYILNIANILHIGMKVYHYYSWTDASSIYSICAPFVEMNDYIVHV